MRPIKKHPNTKLKSKYAEGTLESGNVGEGEEIPYSKFTVKEKDYADITIEKYAKALSLIHIYAMRNASIIVVMNVRPHPDAQGLKT